MIAAKISVITAGRIKCTIAISKISIGAGVVALIAVSYTHLDVYKRQPH